MKFIPFVLKHLKKNWVRTASTVLAMALCIFLFCTLETILDAVSWGLKSASASRIVTRHQVSLIYEMPLSYKQKIAAVPGIKNVAIMNWFGGIYQNEMKNFFANFAVESEHYFPMHPEFRVKPDEMKAYMEDMRGCLVGKKTAERFGWKIGDTVQLESNIPPNRIGKPFEFVVRGIYDADEVAHPGTDLTLFFFHYKYLYESTGRRIAAGMYIEQIDDPSQAGAMSRKIDALFQNSDAETRTETETAFRAGFVSMAGNLALLLRGIGLAVSFTILLVTANTMSMAVRERRNEIAVLKTLGFPSGLVMFLLLSEAIVLAVIGGLVGLGMGGLMISVLPSFPLIGDAVRQFPNLGLNASIVTRAFSTALLLGVLAGFVPALLAYRSRITDMLRQV